MIASFGGGSAPAQVAKRVPKAAASGDSILVIENIEVVYQHTVQVLRGLSLSVPSGQIVALLGSNGAGKTTTLKAISNLLPLEVGQLRAGTIRYLGERIDATAPHLLARHGIAHVREGRHVFEDLTVEENLIVAGNALNGRSEKPDLAMIYEYFPRLKDRRTQRSGYLSGGEQQMLAIGRALIGLPKLMLLDEPSLGLAPLVVQDIFKIVARINREQGVAMLLVEQNAMAALDIAHYGYIMEGGKIVIDGTTAKLAQDADVQRFYLGYSEGEGELASFRNVKHYKRRKRWLS
ncbi:ABC transporter ATP-binding protein [Hydrogenophaga sp. 2FB]|uniref:ABC transporter ATP-binding protein n=1 Tax=Hydrogenophaga sp. 2FB TaxID=2502187 RepID=UPI0010F9641A|nr:ABC transporter ATP-binding protein [Hydrogenophaga sp. 2FB]